MAAVTDAAAAVETAFPRAVGLAVLAQGQRPPGRDRACWPRADGAPTSSRPASGRAPAPPGSPTTGSRSRASARPTPTCSPPSTQAVAGTPLRWVAVESADELARLAELHRLRRDGARRATSSCPVLLRLNPDVCPETAPGFAVGLASSKFGLSADDLEDLAARAVWQRRASTARHPRAHGIPPARRRGLGRGGRRAVELLARVRRSTPARTTSTSSTSVAASRPTAPTRTRGVRRRPGRRARRAAGLALPRCRRSSPAAWWSARPAGWSPACCTPACVATSAGDPRRRDDRADPARALRQPAPGHRADRRPTSRGRAWARSWSRVRSASRPTRSASTRSRRCSAATWWSSTRPARTPRRSRLVTTAGPRPPRSCCVPTARSRSQNAPHRPLVG